MNVEELREISDKNRAKYLKAPSILEIDTFIKELQVSDAQFERFFGMPFNTMGVVRNGQRKLPAKYWHIVYEKIVPAYSKLHEETIAKKPSGTKNKTPAPTPNRPPKIDPMEDDRISQLLS